MRVNVGALPASCADPPPAAHKGNLAEERRLDGQFIKTRHVAFAHDAVEKAGMRRGSHGALSGGPAGGVQRIF